MSNSRSKHPSWSHDLAWLGEGADSVLAHALFSEVLTSWLMLMIAIKKSSSSQLSEETPSIVVTDAIDVSIFTLVIVDT